MSQAPQCVQCGGTEYSIESGYYFCVECHVQSQDIHEQVYDESFSAARGTRISIAPAVLTETVERSKGSELTSWEVLNYILKGLVDELILLGASKDLKIVIIQLWASYLMKNEIAFLSSDVEIKPRLGVTFKTRDAEIVYGTDPKLLYACKRPIFRKNMGWEEGKPRKRRKSDVFTTLRAKKFQITQNKKALAKADYESRSDTSVTSGLTLESLGKSSYKSDGSQKSCRLRYSKHAKQVLSNLIENAKELDVNDRRSLQSVIMLREKESLRHPCVKKLIAIIRLALLITASPIQYSDLFRWNREGYLSVRNAEKFLPSSVEVNKDVKALFVKSLGSWGKCQRDTYKLAQMMHCTDLYVDIASLCKRYCNELSLPDDVLEIIMKLFAIKIPRMEMSSTSNYEGRAMALIIVVLKLLFSLDDCTEYKISEVANKINCVIDKDRRVFSWTEWVEHINCRSAVVSAYCQATRDRYYPNSRVGGPAPFIAQWDYSPIRQKIPRKEVIDNQTAESIRKAMGPLASSAIKPLPPSMSPLSDLTMNLLDCNMLDSVRNILQNNYKNSSLKWLLSLSAPQELKEEFGLKFDIRHGVGVDFTMANQALLVGHRQARKKLGDKTCQVSVTFKQSQARYRTRDSNQDSSEGSDSADIFLDKHTESKNDQGNFGKKNVASRIDLTAPFTCDSCDDEDILYFPQTDYWFYHGIFMSVSILDFYRLAQQTLPSSFFWLLQECSRVIDQNIRDLYCQVITVEKMYFLYLSPHYKKPQYGFPLHFFQKW